YSTLNYSHALRDDLPISKESRRRGRKPKQKQRPNALPPKRLSRRDSRPKGSRRRDRKPRQRQRPNVLKLSVLRRSDKKPKPRLKDRKSTRLNSSHVKNSY